MRKNTESSQGYEKRNDTTDTILSERLNLFVKLLINNIMNKQEASKIIQAYQDYRHWDDYSLYPIPELDELNDALDLAVKELAKSDNQ